MIRGQIIKRALKAVRRNPGLIKTVCRMEYRHRLGIDLDRRHQSFLSGPPTNLSINLTMRCNLHCRMCRHIHYVENRPPGRDWYDIRKELPLSAWISVLNEIRPYRPLLYVTGGEPTLYPHFDEFIIRAKDMGFMVILQTNGTLLTKYATLLVEKGVEGVSISLDGPPEIHNAVRGSSDAFQRLERGVNALIATRTKLGFGTPFVSFNYTISKGNVDHLPRIAPLAASLGADFLQIQHTMFNSPDKTIRHNEMFTDIQLKTLGIEASQPPICPGEEYLNELTAADLPKLQAGLLEALEKAAGRLKIHFIPNLPEDLLAPYYLNLNYPFPEKCVKFWQCLRILADGTVSPCLNFIAGNVTTQSVAEIWNGPRMRKLRELVSRRLFPACERCCSRTFVQDSRAF